MGNMRHMVKRNLKRLAFIMTGLLLMGLSGLMMALVELNYRYQDRDRALNMMSGQMNQLEYRVNHNRQKLANYEFMEYKINAFSQRYPTYAEILNTVYDKSAQYGFEPDLVLGMIKVESNFNPKAVSYRGAYGLMQVNLAVWRKELGIVDNRVFEVDYNIDLGLQILKRYYLESSGNMKRALHLYNNGYLYNNTAYAGQVSSAAMDITNHRAKAQALSR
jgi:soluble lytic murein transglycosylase-like protein